MPEFIDPHDFRRVLGHFPTGVVAVTSLDVAGNPIGMIVGSFTSVSLSPPLVAFLPGKQSSTSPKILHHGRFCVNVLGAHQEAASRSFTSGRADKFQSLDWTPTSHGLPRLADAIAWIECAVEAVHEAGDHDIVIGRVTAMEAAGTSPPLLFFQGGYGRFAPMSFAAAGESDLIEHLRLIDVARPHMEAVAKSCQVECLASAAVGDEMVLLAAAGTPADGRPYSRVGQRLPLIPPLGTALVAWSEPASEAWLNRAVPDSPPSRRPDLEAMLARVRDRGWSVVTWSDRLRDLEATVDQLTHSGSTPPAHSTVRRLIAELNDEHEPANLEGQAQLRSVTVPVFDQHQRVALQLTLRLPPHAARGELDSYLQALQEAAERTSAAIARLFQPHCSAAGLEGSSRR